MNKRKAYLLVRDDMKKNGDEFSCIRIANVLEANGYTWVQASMLRQHYRNLFAPMVRLNCWLVDPNNRYSVHSEYLRKMRLRMLTAAAYGRKSDIERLRATIYKNAVKSFPLIAT